MIRQQKSRPDEVKHPNNFRRQASQSATQQLHQQNSPPLLRSIAPPRIWQWPNIMALDAVLIALAWQQLLATLAEYSLSLTARVVLACSIWLTYMADRLFDVANRPTTQLRSTRHRFAQKHARTLWISWGIVLIINLVAAFTILEAMQLRNGGALLIACLLYTALNQRYSRSFFPKEICVALIFTGGVIVFLPYPWPKLAAASLSLLCLTNCLMIGSKERDIDAAMQVRSMAQWSFKLILLLWSATGLLIYFLDTQLKIAVSLSLAALLIIQIRQTQIPVERFRVLSDTALLIGPVAALLCQP
jgi:hypothetical protein